VIRIAAPVASRKLDPHEFSRPMSLRILLVTHHRTFKALGRAWRVGNVARSLAQAGHAVTVLCTADTARRGVRESEVDGFHLVETPDLLWGRQRSGWDPWNAWTRARWLRGRQFDIVHAFETRPSVIHPLLGWLRRHPAPLVLDWCDWWGRGGLIEENRPAWYRLLFGGIETHYEENYRARADATTVIARGLAGRAAGLGVPADSIFWLPNGCWPDDLRPVDSRLHRAALGLPADDFLAGFNALDVTVGFDLVLAGFARAAAQNPRLTLVLTGRLPPAQLARIEAAQLGDRVRSLGFVPAADYPKVLGSIDAFLLPFIDRPANHGRWPGRINDYLCVGRPVITQPVGEMKILLEREPIGRLCAATPDAVAAALLELQSRPELGAAFGRRARELAESTLSWRALGPTLEAAYAHARRAHAAR